MTPNIYGGGGVFMGSVCCLFVDVGWCNFCRVWSESCASYFVRIGHEVDIFHPCVYS